MICEKTNIQNATKYDKNRRVYLEEILHSQDQDAMYMEMVMSSAGTVEAFE